MLSSHLLPLSLTLLIQTTLADYTTSNTSNLHDNSQDCSCYEALSGGDSTTPSYFSYHRFFDFRNLASGPGEFLTAPPLVNNSQDAGAETVFPQYASNLNSSAWNVDWGIQNWSKPADSDFPVRMVNSPANVYILQNNDSDPANAFTYLTLRVTRLDDFSSAAEIESEQQNLMYVSMRMYARVLGAKGAVAGFFTFFDDQNESDIEILTDDATDTIRYTNQPAVGSDGNDVPGASLEKSKLPAWDEWQEHRIDWLEKECFWYADGRQVARNTYSVPRKVSYLVINMWSDGGVWSGNMTEGSSAEFQIQWIEMVFNTSGPVEGPGFEKRKEEGCKTVCKIDGVQTVGTPEKVGAAAAAAVSWGVLLVLGVVSIVVGL
ncbi:glycoside hydrolase family 16 protein [Lophiostoma macrostomum CBS 122681]|uniref:Glycoside hydrolase family 16 protein n=1 Tax=Lophiostoma macrostomum CBS 122681 TaxID=1314788 RepID=A0A6A6TQT5_9PLEO|nr:glycoside hydrolase family 16 protein [Lophiostoma macrostomum CBS 122681]